MVSELRYLDGTVWKRRERSDYSQTTTTTSTYGPVSTTTVGAVGSPPQDANYVTWSWARSSGMTLNAALRTMGANDILVLPEDSQPYELDSSNGFTATGSYQGFVRLTGRGILGMGPGSIVQPSASSYTAAAQTSGTPVSSQIEFTLANTYFGNFTMYGRDFGGYAYHGISSVEGGASSGCERVKFVGAHRGFKNAPPGETGAFKGYQGNGQWIRNCEIDCRDASSGLRVASSPYMFNNQSNITVTDVYAHHSKAGMPTFYAVTGTSTITRLRSEYNGSGAGDLSGSSHNFEQCTGSVTMTDCIYICNYRNNIYADPDTTSPGNTGLHVSIGSNAGSMTMQIVNPTNDLGPFSGVLSFQLGSTYSGQTDTQQLSDISVVDHSGNAVAWQQSGK